MKQSQRRLLRAGALMLIVMLALGLRLCGNTYGLPNQYAPDEAAKVKVAREFRDHPFQHSNSQPSFLYSALFLTDLAADALEPLIRNLHPKSAILFPPEFGREPVMLWLGRCLMALISAMTCLVVYRLGREVSGPGAGLAAAWLFGVSPLSVAAATYIKEDTPLTFFVTLGLLMGLRHWRKRTMWSACHAGLAAGAAFSAKYPGALLLIWLIGVTAMIHWSSRREKSESSLKRSGAEIGVILISSLGAFLILCPGYAMRPGQLFDGVNFQINYMQSGHHDGIAITAWEFGFLFYLTRAVIPGIGALTCVAALAGTVVLWRRDKGRAALLLTWGVGYYLLAEMMKSKPYPFFHRYILPVIPVAAALAGVAIRQFWIAGKINWPVKRSQVAAIIAIFAILISPLYLTERSVAVLIPDNRDQARDWVDNNLEAGDWLLQTGYGAVWNRRIDFQNQPLSEESLRQAIEQRAEGNVYVMLSSFAYERHLIHSKKSPGPAKFYSQLLETHEPVAEFKRRGGPFGFHNPGIIVLRVKTLSSTPSNLQ